MLKYDTAIVLAGGKHTRMGEDKEKLAFNNEYLIDRIIKKLKTEFSEIIVVTADVDFYHNRGVIAIEDEIKNIGPIGGLYTGLKLSSSEYAYVTACDMPNINYGYIHYQKELIDKSLPDVIIPIVNGYYERLGVFYSIKIINKIERNIKNKNFSLYKLIEESNVVVISQTELEKISYDLDMFVNLNTQDDLKEFIENM